MVDTNTANIGLLLPDLGDTFNFALHVENNFSTIDGLMGAPSCTSATRPSNTYKGQVIYETDSGRYVQNTGTKASPTWTYMSHSALSSTSSAHPSVGVTTGLRIYETDTGLEAFWNGSAWVYPPQKIASSVLGGTAASIPLTIPSGVAARFSALKVMWAARSTDANPATYQCYRLNGDSGNNYEWQFNQANNTSLAGTISSGGSVAQVQIGTMPAATATASYMGGGEFNLTNPGGSTYKMSSGHSMSMQANNTGYAGAYGGQWNNTGAVTLITLFPQAGSYVAGSYAAVWGM